MIGLQLIFTIMKISDIGSLYGSAMLQHLLQT